MSYKDILLHLEPGVSAANTAATRFACTLAAAHEAHVSALVCEVDPVRPIGFKSGPLDLDMPNLIPDQSEAVAAAREAFAIAARNAGVVYASSLSQGFAYDIGEALAGHLRVRDLAVIGVERSMNDQRRMLLEETLFDTGRPIVLVPEAYETLAAPASVVIAWDDSRPAARAVADAMGILTKAKAVTIVSVDDASDYQPGQSGAELANHLARHGISAEFAQVQRGPKGVFADILAEAHGRKADIIVMGAYGHSRLRQMIFGGATRAVFDGAASIPVLMSN
ncbi:MAG: universal stress protein [Hyphomicrobiaceae bacterium]|nr:universal stress protein [Hyphomicrobiaceae bacterium]